MSHTTASLALITFGLWEMLLLFGIVMLLFGARKLPLLARGLGSSVKNFKTELKAPPDDTESEDR